MNTETQKEKLTQEKTLLEKELSTVAVPSEHAVGGFEAKEDDSSGQGVADVIDMGDEQASLARNESISSELETRLGNINKALEAIKSDTYGKCTVCETEIEEDRLEANPAALTCKEHMEEVS